MTCFIDSNYAAVSNKNHTEIFKIMRNKLKLKIKIKVTKDQTIYATAQRGRSRSIGKRSRERGISLSKDLPTPSLPPFQGRIGSN